MCDKFEGWGMDRDGDILGIDEYIYCDKTISSHIKDICISMLGKKYTFDKYGRLDGIIYDIELYLIYKGVAKTTYNDLYQFCCDKIAMIYEDFMWKMREKLRKNMFEFINKKVIEIVYDDIVICINKYNSFMIYDKVGEENRVYEFEASEYESLPVLLFANYDYVYDSFILKLKRDAKDFMKRWSFGRIGYDPEYD